jgi:hypothetical protein
LAFSKSSLKLLKNSNLSRIIFVDETTIYENPPPGRKCKHTGEGVKRQRTMVQC